MGCGDFVHLEQVTSGRVRSFLESLDRFATPLANLMGTMDGTDQVLASVQRWLHKQQRGAA